MIIFDENFNFLYIKDEFALFHFHMTTSSQMPQCYKSVFINLIVVLFPLIFHHARGYVNYFLYFSYLQINSIWSKIKNISTFTLWVAQSIKSHGLEIRLILDTSLLFAVNTKWCYQYSLEYIFDLYINLWNYRKFH